MRLSFHGADQDVTGSCHLPEADGAGRRIDAACRPRTLAAENSGEFGFDGAQHRPRRAHARGSLHCGRLPLLVRRGSRGENPDEAGLSLVLLDAAKLQSDKRRVNREEPLYTPAACRGRAAL